jgi:hypothetical protein
MVYQTRGSSVVYYVILERVGQMPSYESKYSGTRQRFHRSSHVIPLKIFDDVEERERGERKRSLLREQPPYKIAS